jgi:hypothetical protein
VCCRTDGNSVIVHTAIGPTGRCVLLTGTHRCRLCKRFRAPQSPRGYERALYNSRHFQLAFRARKSRRGLSGAFLKDHRQRRFVWAHCLGSSSDFEHECRVPVPRRNTASCLRARFALTCSAIPFKLDETKYDGAWFPVAHKRASMAHQCVALCNLVLGDARPAKASCPPPHTIVQTESSCVDRAKW